MLKKSFKFLAKLENLEQSIKFQQNLENLEKHPLNVNKSCEIWKNHEKNLQISEHLENLEKSLKLQQILKILKQTWKITRISTDLEGFRV